MSAAFAPTPRRSGPRWLCWWALLGCLAPLLAQAATSGEATLREFYFRTTGIEQGLSENTVSAVMQDREGYLWVGTDGPLQRYDGYDFVAYPREDAARTNTQGTISALAQDEADRIWVGSSGAGLLRLAPGGRMLQPVAVDAKGVRRVYALLADSRHGIWVGSERGVLLLDAASGALKRSWTLAAETSRSPIVRGIVRMSDDALYVAASNGLWRIAPDAPQAQRVDAEHLDAATSLIVDAAGDLRVGTPQGLFGIDAQGRSQRLWPLDGDAVIGPIAEDPQQRLWIAVPGKGIAIVDPATRRTHWLRPDPLTPGSLPDANVTALQIDRSGLLWIGTHDRGLSRTDPGGAPFRYVVDHNAAPGTNDLNDVHALAADADDGLWIGEARGLKRYVAERNRFEYEDQVVVLGGDKPRAAQALPHISAIAADGGRYWIASALGVGLFDPRAHTYELLGGAPVALGGEAPSQVRCLAVGGDHSLWIGTMRDGLLRYQVDGHAWSHFRHDATQSAASLGGDMVLAVHVDRKGMVWAGTDEGLNLIDPASGRTQLIRNLPGDAHSLSSNLVLSIHESAAGDLWVGTQSGVNRLDTYDAGRTRFSRWPQGDAQPVAVYAIESDGLGRLWLGTNRGIGSLDATNNVLQLSTTVQGLQGLKYNIGASARLHGGELAFGGSDGINLFRPQAIIGSRFAAPVVITAIDIGPRENAGRGDSTNIVHMRARDGVVHFEFAVLDFAAPERNRFAYQLEGFDDHWIEAGPRHDATYTNLSPGHYVFRVRGANRDGFWNPLVARADLDVVPPWWQSLPAKTAYLLLGLGAALLGWRVHRERRREEVAHHRDLRDREDRLRLALWGSGDDFWDWDLASDRFVLTGSRQLFTSDGTSTDGTFLRWFRERVHPDDLAQVEQRFEAHLRGDADNYEAEYRLRKSRGGWIWILARGKIVERDAYGQPLRMCGTTRDITAERAFEQERRIAHEVLRSMGEAVVVNDLDFRFTTINPAFTRITGWTQEEIEGRSLSLLDCARHPAEIYRELRKTLLECGQWRGELWQRRKNGEEFLSWCEVLEVRDSNGVRTHFVGVISDITDRKRAEQELRYLANYDALTGLPNRSLLIERINQGIGRAQRGDHKLAVLFLDLDRFKHVNDSMGHAAGDSLLRAAGARLRQIVRGNDSVARIGGDEFTVVLEDVESSNDAEATASKILAAFEQPLELDNGQEVVISASIGISLYPDHAASASDLLKFADTAMYQAKEHGRRTWMIYVEAMDAAARLRAMTIAAMHKALERDEFQLRYQPKMSLHDDRITGFEALLRWHSQDMGDVAPGVFIPIAEETGMIVEIGNWVFEHACRQLAQWREEGMADITLSINVSVAQLMHADLIPRLNDVLAAHDIPPGLLELELTESMVMANAEQSITTLRRLKAVGVNLAIDDFGTGYSSLSYLKRLPIDALKIDKEFVGDLTTDPDDEAITATVIAMAHSLGLNVIAEGVEEKEQVDYLREQDCDEVQGHWLAKPLPPGQCSAFVQAHELRRRAHKAAAAVTPRH